MNDSPHPGRLLRRELEELGIGVAEAAGALGVTRQQLYRVLAEQSGVSPEMALRLEKALGGSAEMWLRVQASHDLVQARKRISTLAVRKLESKAA